MMFVNRTRTNGGREKGQGRGTGIGWKPDDAIFGAEDLGLVGTQLGREDTVEIICSLEFC